MLQQQLSVSLHRGHLERDKAVVSPYVHVGSVQKQQPRNLEMAISCCQTQGGVMAAGLRIDVSPTVQEYLDELRMSKARCEVQRRPVVAHSHRHSAEVTCLQLERLQSAMPHTAELPKCHSELGYSVCERMR